MDDEVGAPRMRWLAELGVPTIHVSIGAEPLSVAASRISILADPADGLESSPRAPTDAPTASHRRRPAA